MKKVFLFLGALVMSTTLFGQAASWMGNSFIVANGQWYNGSGKGNTAFDGLNLGVIDTLYIGGQVQSYGDSDGANNPAFMKYKIDGGKSDSIKLDWYKYDNNNFFGAHGETPSLTTVAAFDTLADGEHTIAVWFTKPSTNGKDGYIYDSNDGKNYVATFTKGTPVVQYFAKNNWDDPNPDNWTWREMTAAEDDIYQLDSVVFGGTGVNINTKKDDKDAIWFPANSIIAFDADTLLPLDTVLLIYDAEQNILLASLIGRPCKDEYGILVNGNYQVASVNPKQTQVKEYMVLGVALAVDDSVQMFNNCAKEAWVIEDYMDESYLFLVVNNKYVVEESGTYDFYFQLGPDKIYIYQQQTTALKNNSESIIPNSKFIENGNLYIRRGNVIFDAQGKMIR